VPLEGLSKFYVVKITRMVVYDLVAIGNPVYDIIETPFVKSIGRVLSGCSFNVAFTAKRLGMKEVALVGSIGGDFEERFLKTLRRIGLHFIKAGDAEETAGFRLRYLSYGDRELEVLGFGGEVSMKRVPQEVFNASAVVVGPVLGEVGIEVPSTFRKRGSVVFLDPQGYLRRVRGRVVEYHSNPEALEACRESYLVKPNELEARLLSGFDEPLKAAVSIHQKAGAVTALTLAERGSVIVNGRRAILVPAYPTHIVDPTGAGDVYLGALAYYIRNGLSLEDAASYASAIASLKVEGIAAYFNLDLEKVVRRARWIRSRVKVKRMK
jgi:sugar/nucleoside kinase (ribokinase family)